MRTDIVAGAVFPDYELTDHTGKRRRLSDLQGPDPMILVLSRGDTARGTCGRPKVWSNFTARWKSVSPA
jgi:peroxiredoxin